MQPGLRLTAILLAIFCPLAWGFNSAEWPNTDFDNTSIDLGEVMSGGPPKDGIPSIDEPSFISQQQAEDWLGPNEPVIVLAEETEARAYPLQILMWHEIVNDEIAGRPVSVTFCPLCNASIVFDRELDGTVYDFGTTGRLRRSDMIMYDRQTESWWQQFVGEAIVGELTGKKLRQIPSQIVAFNTFRRYYPDGVVLSRDTGHSRRYGQNPYTGYDDINSTPFLYRGEIDDRLPPMERVLSVQYKADTLLFALTTLREAKIVNTRFADKPLAVFAFETMNSALDQQSIADSRLVAAASVYDPTIDGQALTFRLQGGMAIDAETGSTWNTLGQAVEGPLQGRQLPQIDSGVHFAFAWLAFDPDAQIYKPQ